MQEKLTSEKYWDLQYETRSKVNSVEGLLFRSIAARQIVDVAKKYFIEDPDFRLLEFGCGGSYLLALMHKIFKYKVEGIDYSDSGCRLARGILAENNVRGTIYKGDFLKDDRGVKEKYNVCISSGVIEHFEKPEKVIKIFARALKKNGIMLTVVPDLTGMQGSLQRFLGRTVYTMHKVLPLDRLRSLHEANDLSVVFSGRLGVFTLGFNIDKERKILAKIYRAYAYLLNRICCIIDAAMPRLLRGVPGSAFIVVAVKR